jgi:proteasome component ECM29
MQHDDVRKAMIKIALREAKRQNVEYRPHAVKALARVSRARDDLNLSDEVFEIANNILSEQADPDAMEIDGVDQKRKAEQTQENTTVAAVEAIFGSINPKQLSDEKLTTAVSRATHAVIGLRNQSPAVWRNTYTSLRTLFDRLQEANVQLVANAALARDLYLIVHKTSVEIEAVRRLQDELSAAIASSQPALSRQIQESAETSK